MEVSLVTAASDLYWDLFMATIPNKIEYCIRWNVNFIPKKHTTGNIDNERQEFMIEAWHRSKALDSWLWFMGADTLIMNHTIDVRKFLDKDYDLIIGQDINGINNDVFFLQNTWKSKQFLEATLAYNKTMPNDQESMALVIDEMKPDLRTKVVPQKEFNSYLYNLYHYPDDNGGNYTDGDFVLHLPGLSNQQRMKLVTEYLQKVTK